MKHKTKIGIVGLGIMGGGMASNFLKKGYKLYVFNRTRSVAKSYGKKGAVVCASAKDVAKNADIVFEVTANDKSSGSVWLGRNGILAGASKTSILIASATLSINWTDKLSQKCKKLGFTFFDMPLTGGRTGAESGNLTLLCGGDEKILSKIKPILRAVSNKIIYFGGTGQGMRFKLLLNFIQALHVASFGQALKIAKENNMDLKKVGQSLAEKPGGTGINAAWRDFQKPPDNVNFSVEWITKDLTYAKKFAKDLDVKLLDGVLSEYRKLVKKGLSKRDWSKINDPGL